MHSNVDYVDWNVYICIWLKMRQKNRPIINWNECKIPMNSQRMQIDSWRLLWLFKFEEISILAWISSVNCCLFMCRPYKNRLYRLECYRRLWYFQYIYLHFQQSLSFLFSSFSLYSLLFVVCAISPYHQLILTPMRLISTIIKYWWQMAVINCAQLRMCK